MDSRGRYVIGLLGSGLADAFSKDVSFGVLQRAEEENVNVVIFPGKFINRELPDDLRYEYQYNTLFQMITEDNIDAVIIMADCIGCHGNKQNIVDFIDYYAEIPCVLAACKYEDKSCIMYDNYKGIEEGITYLIENKGCTKFAMLGGPDANTDASERKESFIKILKANGITFSEENFVVGNLSRTCTKEAGELLDKNPDVEVIFCVNDDTAVALYEVMKERGLVPGEDIYVLGYDNSRESGQLRPALSTIWADPVELSRQAFDMAMNLLRGRKTPTRKLDTMFVKRDSFGTEVEKIDLADMDKNQIKAVYNKVFYRLQGARGSEYRAYQKVIKACLALINSEEYNIELHKELLGTFKEAVDTGILYYADIELLQIVVDEIYRQISDGEARRKDRKEVRDGYASIYRQILASQEERIHQIVMENMALDYSIKLVAQDVMRFENGNDQNYAVLLRKLPALGIHNANLYMLENPVVHLDGEEWVCPEHVYLKATLKNDEAVAVQASKQKLSSKMMYRDGIFGDYRYSAVLMPLYSNEIMYGYLLAEESNQIYDNGEILVNQMSAAVKMIQVLKNSEDIMTQLEESLVTLRDNNIILDNMSRVDVLTEIFNRRGFMDSALHCLTASYETGIPLMIMYVDMDNLKIVNDRYGHDEGDFSLKFIAQTIKDIVGDKGTAGRLGGDEFAAIMWDDVSPSEVKAMISKKFADFNATSDKDYNISASIGIYKVEPEVELTLEEALERADMDLYEEKKKRKKTVSKK